MNSYVLIWILFFSCSSHIYAQYDFFIVGNDTTYCSDLNFGETMQGYLRRIAYTDLSGTAHEVIGRREVPDVVSFFIDSVYYDKTPQKPAQPNSYIRYTERKLDGAIIVYVEYQGYQETRTIDLSTVPNGNLNHPSVGYKTGGAATGTFRFFVKINDGKGKARRSYIWNKGSYYNLRKKHDREKIIIPYMMQCEAFRMEYERHGKKLLDSKSKYREVQVEDVCSIIEK